jgi:Arsenical resistance operon protein ArsD
MDDEKEKTMVRVLAVQTITVQVYDPAMCCTTGVCGPSVDPQLVQIAQDLQWFQSQGINVQRYNLAQQPDIFVKNTRVAGLLQAFENQALPAVLVNDEIVSYGRYASREEMLAALQQIKTQEPKRPQAPNTSCCGPDGCC